MKGSNAANPLGKILIGIALGYAAIMLAWKLSGCDRYSKAVTLTVNFDGAPKTKWLYKTSDATWANLKQCEDAAPGTIERIKAQQENGDLKNAVARSWKCSWEDPRETKLP